MDLKVIRKKIKHYFPNFYGLVKLFTIAVKDNKRVRYVKKIGKDKYPELLERYYYNNTGKKLDLQNPVRFTEKIQWRKLYDQHPVYAVLSDKLAVREWVSQKIGEQYLIPLLGSWSKSNEIRFGDLPDSFVLKTNNASATNIVVKNKKEFLRGKIAIRAQIQHWLNTPFGYMEGLELHYNLIKPMIIAEQYLVPEEGCSDLRDFKFYCFDGEPLFCQVISNRTTGETIDFYDCKWKHLDIKRPPYNNSEQAMLIPDNYEEMIRLVKCLCSGFKHVRVDFYDNAGKIYFGEMTFTSASGIGSFKPDKWDFVLGEMWNINDQQIDLNKVGKIKW